MTVIALPAHLHERQRWRNGAGYTREILRGGDAPDWRISIAELDRDCEFSRFDGCARHLLLLSGSGLNLHIDGHAAATLQRPYSSQRFDGEASVSASLADGPCQAFNLIYRPDAVRAELLHRPLLGNMVIFLRPGQQWLLHLAGGQARVREGENTLQLAQGDSAWLQGANGRVLIEGGGDVVLVRIEPIRSTDEVDRG